MLFAKGTIEGATSFTTVAPSVVQGFCNSEYQIVKLHFLEAFLMIINVPLMRLMRFQPVYQPWDACRNGDRAHLINEWSSHAYQGHNACTTITSLLSIYVSRHFPLHNVCPLMLQSRKIRLHMHFINFEGFLRKVFYLKIKRQSPRHMRGISCHKLLRFLILRAGNFWQETDIHWASCVSTTS